MRNIGKLLAMGISGFIGGYVLAMLVGFAKLLSLSTATWSGDVSLVVPVMHIESGPHEFVARSMYGVFVVAAVGAVAAMIATSVAARSGGQAWRLETKQESERS